MKTANNKQHIVLPQKQSSLLWKILKFMLILVLEIIASKPKRYEPTLQEQVMGEELPFSGQYYIPDDQYRR